MNELLSRVIWQLSWLVPTNRLPERWRIAVLRARGLQIADGAQVRPGSVFTEYRTSIGSGSMVGWCCFFADHAPVTIGRNVWIAAHSKFYTDSHALGDADLRAGEWYAKPITVGDGTWIGGNTTVLPGVRIGAGCVVAAGSVVREDCAPNGLYAGVPAVRKRELN